MAAPRIRTRDEWQARAITLAADAHASGTARHIGTNEHGAQLYRVPSSSHDGVYLVSVWPHGAALCCCTAGSYERPCKHAGAAILAERARQEATNTTQNEPLRSFAHGLSW